MSRLFFPYVRLHFARVHLCHSILTILPSLFSRWQSHTFYNIVILLTFARFELCTNKKLLFLDTLLLLW